MKIIHRILNIFKKQKEIKGNMDEKNENVNEIKNQQPKEFKKQNITATQFILTKMFEQNEKLRIQNSELIEINKKLTNQLSLILDKLSDIDNKTLKIMTQTFMGDKNQKQAIHNSQYSTIQTPDGKQKILKKVGSIDYDALKTPECVGVEENIPISSMMNGK